MQFEEETDIRRERIPMLLNSKTAVITGCNRGIGKAILEDVAEHGANVFAVVRKSDAAFEEYCNSLAKEKNIEIRIVCADFTDEEQVKLAAKEIISAKKPIDILVNNIGVSLELKSLAMTKMKTIHEVFQINFFSAIAFTQMISKNMMRHKAGSIIFISSSAAFDGGANLEYSASKAALIGAVRRLALELGPFNIRVNAIAPGLTETDMGNSMSEEDEAIAMSRNIMGRKGRPEEIADVTVFLASEMSRFMTGQVLRVDGGLIK